jgi:hypothetical protein
VISAPPFQGTDQRHPIFGLRNSGERHRGARNHCRRLSEPYGFAKSEKANVSAKELKALKRLANLLLGYADAELVAAKSAGELVEVIDSGGNEQKT